MSVHVLRPGDAFGPYRLVKRAGKGGMAEFWVAEPRDVPPRMGAHELGLKILGAPQSERPEMRARLSAEYRLAAQIRHPCFVPAFELGQFEGRPFIEMAYVPGVNLEDLREHAIAEDDLLPVGLVVHLGVQLAEGLIHLHGGAQIGESIVHCDISPDNVRLTPRGEVKVLDFGVAWAQARTGGGRARGKPAYMAPEQATAGPVDTRADVYATGVVLWELLANTRLFAQCQDADAVPARPVPPAIRVLRRDVPWSLQELLQDMLQVDVSRRPSARAVLRRLSSQAQPSMRWDEDIGARVRALIRPRTKMSLLSEIEEATVQLDMDSDFDFDDDEPTETMKVIPQLDSGRGGSAAEDTREDLGGDGVPARGEVPSPVEEE